MPRRPVVTIKSDCDLCNLLVLGKSRVQSLREGPQVVKAILCFVPYSLQCCDVVARELNNDVSTGTFEVNAPEACIEVATNSNFKRTTTLMEEEVVPLGSLMLNGVATNSSNFILTMGPQQNRRYFILDHH